MPVQIDGRGGYDSFALTSRPTGVMLLTRRQPFYPSAAHDKFFSICTAFSGYTEFGIAPSGKAFYFIVTAAEDKPALERTMDGLRGLTDCIPDAKVCGCIYGANAWQLGDIQGNPALNEAYEMGKAI